jgi:O-antigen/teichoic acid export membrane protein
MSTFNARSAGVIVGATVIAQTVAAIAGIFLARLYTPADYGVWGIYLAFIAVAGVVACARYELAIPLPRDEVLGRALYKGSWLILSLTTAVVGLTVIVLRFSEVTASKTLQSLLKARWALPLGLLALGAVQANSFLAIRERAYGRLAGARIIQNVVQAIVQLTCGVFGTGPGGILAGDVLGRFSAAVSLFHVAKNRSTESSVRWTPPRALFEYRWFALRSSGASLLNSIGFALPPLVLAAVFDTKTVGLWALADRVGAVPLAVFGQAAAQTFYGEASKQTRDSQTTIRVLVRSVIIKLLLAGGLVFGVVGILAPYLFDRVLGSQWAESGYYLRILCPMFLLQFAVTPIATSLFITERTELQIKWDLLRLALIVSCFWLSVTLQLGVRATLATYCAASVASYLLMIVLCHRATALVRASGTAIAAAPAIE